MKTVFLSIAAAVVLTACAPEATAPTNTTEGTGGSVKKEPEERVQEK